MSGIVAYRKTDWDASTPAQQTFRRTMLNVLKLGEPVLMDDGTDEWFVFADSRIDPEFVENLAWGDTLLPAVTSEPKREYPVTKTVKRKLPKRVKTPVLDADGAEVLDEDGVPRVRWVDDPSGRKVTVDVEESLGDRLELAVKAQGGPVGFVAFGSVPASWTPVV